MRNIVFVVDVSRSMLVRDVASGSIFISRLDASKARIRETMLAYSGSSLLRFSLVAFTTKSRTIIPPTTSIADALRMTFSLHS